MNRKKRGFVFLCIVLLIIISVCWCYRRPIIKFVKRHFHISSSKKANTCSCNWSSFKLIKKDDYRTVHIPGAQKAANYRFIIDKLELNKQIKKGNIVKIENGEGYIIRGLSSSSKHLTIGAYKTLREMGTRFKNLIKDTDAEDSYFEISSVCRTEAQQEEIKKKYPNAAAKTISTHSYGVSFDIASFKRNSCEIANKALNKVLNQMQDEGKILICPESKCIHITVKKRFF